MVEEKSEEEAFNDLCCYTITHHDPNFIHQYVVDTFAAQTADKKTKPITLTFALVGLYLHLEKNFTGKQVQQAHMQLAKHKKLWPNFNLPEKRGNITVYDVIDMDEGPNRDIIIIKWCETVWASYVKNHTRVRDLVKRELWPRKG
ncbi:MAG: DUF5946 family protein [Methanobacterium sp.]|uniref:DUF5946 family protein n=1 Tax=Methanobacterium sp. TaxID=2164 RepID=UPI003C775CF1